MIGIILNIIGLVMDIPSKTKYACYTWREILIHRRLYHPLQKKWLQWNHIMLFIHFHLSLLIYHKFIIKRIRIYPCFIFLNNSTNEFYLSIYSLLFYPFFIKYTKWNKNESIIKIETLLAQTLWPYFGFISSYSNQVSNNLEMVCFESLFHAITYIFVSYVSMG